MPWRGREEAESWGGASGHTHEAGAIRHPELEVPRQTPVGGGGLQPVLIPGQTGHLHGYFCPKTNKLPIWPSEEPQICVLEQVHRHPRDCSCLR